MLSLLSQEKMKYWIFLPLLVSIVKAQLRVVVPKSLEDSLGLGGVPENVLIGSTAGFGSPQYGEVIVGVAFYAEHSDDNKPANNTHCSKSYCEKYQTFYSSLDGKSGFSKIFVVDRGNCTFVQKAIIAQECGADALIILDNTSAATRWSREDVTRVILADDGHGGKVTVPSLLICYDDGQHLKEAIAEEGNVVLELEWSLPAIWPVHVQFWTDLSQYRGNDFLYTFSTFANILKGHISFELNYFLFNLPKSTLQYCLSDADVQAMGATPQTQGYEYCALAPALISGTGTAVKNAIQGRDVVLETTRQLCIYDTTVEVPYADPSEGKDGLGIKSGYSKEFWDYMNLFWSDDENTGCRYHYHGLDAPNGLSNCSKVAMQSSLTASQRHNVELCMSSGRGLKLLSDTKANRSWTTINVLVNGARLSGSMSPELVIGAVCHAARDPVTGVSRAPECQRLIIESHQQEAPWLPYAGLQWSSIIQIVVFSSIIIGLIFYLYSRKMKHKLKEAMRTEVTGEVRTQMEYFRIEDKENDFKRTEGNLL